MRQYLAVLPCRVRNAADKSLHRGTNIFVTVNEAHSKHLESDDKDLINHLSLSVNTSKMLPHVRLLYYCLLLVR